MTLEELLALLPDNTTGMISAADMREVISGVWDQSATAYAVLDGRLSALENAGTGPTFSGVWQVNSTPNGTPGYGQVSSDSGNFATATKVRFNKQDMLGTDFSVALLAASSLYGQQKADSANWVQMNVTSTLDEGSYIEMVVEVSGFGGDGSAAWQDAVVVLK